MEVIKWHKLIRLYIIDNYIDQIEYLNNELDLQSYNYDNLLKENYNLIKQLEKANQTKDKLLHENDHLKNELFHQYINQ